MVEQQEIFQSLFGPLGEFAIDIAVAFGFAPKLLLIADPTSPNRLRLAFSGVPADISDLRFKRLSTSKYFANAFGSGDLLDAAIGVPALAADGLLLRPSASQIMPLPGEVLSWSKSGAISIVDSAARYSGLLGASISSAGSTSNRAYKNFAWTAGETLFVMVLYSAGTSGKVGVTLRDDSVSTSTIVDGAPGALAVNGSPAAGAVSLISDVVVSGSVRMASMFFTPNSTSALGHVGVGPRSATAGQTVICFGANVWRSSVRQEFETSVTTRAAEFISPKLQTGIYDFLIMTVGGGVEWRSNVPWVQEYPVSADEPMTGTEPEPAYSLLPVTAGKDRMAAVFAFPAGLSADQKISFQTSLAR